MEGPGKYDEVCTSVMAETMADCAIVIIIKGNRGTGFSMQSLEKVNPHIVAAMLENVAMQIREDSAGVLIA